MKICRYCGEAVLFLQRSDKEYCGVKCRVAEWRRRKKTGAVLGEAREGLKDSGLQIDGELKNAMSANPFANVNPVASIEVPESPLSEAELLQIVEE